MELKYGSAKDAGMSQERIDYLENLVSSWVNEGIMQAASMCVVRRGIIVSHASYGPLTLDHESLKLDKDSLFPLASLTKPVTATCLMKLVEDGLLELVDPVSKYIPEFTGEGKHPVKIHHLLTHTSGIRDEDVHYNSSKKLDEGVIVPEPETSQHPNIQKRLYLGYDTPLWKPPGTEMRYFNYGYLLIGEIVRRVSKQSLEEYARKRIFSPLGMKDSYYIVPDSMFNRVYKRAEHIYGSWYSSPEAMRNPSASGGMYSTVKDMAVFGQMFLNKGIYGESRILSPVTVNEMTSNQIPGVSAFHDGEFFTEANWGYGWNIHGNKRDDSGSLRSAQAFDHGGAGGVRLLVDPVYDVVWAYFPIITDQLYTRNLFHNVVMSAINEL